MTPKQPIPADAGKALARAFSIAGQDLPNVHADCIVIGGFAVNYHGYTRNTLDVDFMIATKDREVVTRVMIQAGFTNITRDENFLFFNMPGSPLRVDFLLVDPDTMRGLLDKAVTTDMHGHRVKVPALKDLIAMKIFALSHSLARRRAKDLPDIAYLTVLNDLDLESEIRPLCDRFGTAAIYDIIHEQVNVLRKP